MAGSTIVEPIELTYEELGVVSGGNVGTIQSNRTRQTIDQSVRETGGSVTVGGSGVTAFSGSIHLSETFNAKQSATNNNSTKQSTTGSVVA